MSLQKKSTDPSVYIKDPNARKVLEVFGLIQYFPSKITIQIARRKVTSSVNAIHDVPWYFIGKVLSVLDQQGWYDFDISVSKKKENKAPGLRGFDNLFAEGGSKKGAEGGTKLNSKFDDMFASKGKDEKAAEKLFDIEDVKMAVFLCADNLLQKILSQKLFFSRLCVPFVLPDITQTEKLVVQWWCFRGMRADVDFAHTAAQVVSVIRFTDLPISRVEVLNRLLFDKSHDTFYKSKTRSVDRVSWTNGLIEAASYLPSECHCSSKEECTCPFDQMVLFFYLHGNCTNLPLHKKLVCDLSTLVTVIIDVEQLSGEVIDNIVSVVTRAAKTLIAFTKKAPFPFEDAKEKIGALRACLESENVDDKLFLVPLFDNDGVPFENDTIEKTMRDTIKQVVRLCPGIESLKDKYDALNKDLNTDGQDNLKSDDDDKAVALGQRAARRITDKIKRVSLTSIKEDRMPLQRDQWVKWSEAERNLKLGRNKSDNESQEEFIERIRNEQKRLRREQVEVYRTGMSDIMKQFCSTITEESLDKDYGIYPRIYFLEWLSIFLTDLTSREVQGYRTKLEELIRYGSKRNLNRSLTEETKAEAKKLRDLINSVSFDVRHFFREVGQIVEACLASQDVKLEAQAKAMSKAVATLFLESYPLEILDSNAKQVPIEFLTSVFAQVKKLLAEKHKDCGNIFILSVLGIQSSGKSTLLNAMFGTQFATNIGLCTEGINAELIPIPKELQTNGYEYILLLDTKGLFGTDRDVQDPHSSDNELATLIFGVSDLTILNMMGAAKTVVENILQVVAHAMLKIKQVNADLCIEPRCLFVHQNVDEASAKDILRGENAKFQDDLDSIVKTVAGKLNLPGITCFSDIIKFDINEDIIYVPNLWKGSPPAATINKGYSAKVSEILNHIYKGIMPNVTGFKADINAFSIRLRDVWSALLGTNFIFSFRNHLEINAYASLEAKFNNLRWNLNTAVSNIFNAIREDKEKDMDKQEDVVQSMMDSELITQRTDLIDFFEKTSEGSLLQDLKQRYTKLLDHLAEDKAKTVMKLLKREIEVERRKEKVRPKLDAWKEEARKKAILKAQAELAKGEKAGKRSENEIEKEFNKLWIELLKSVPKPERDSNLPEMVRAVIQDVGNLVPEQTKSIDFETVTNDYLEVDKGHFYVLPEAKLPPDFNIRETIKSKLTSNILEKVDDYLTEISDDIFDKSHIEQTLQIVMRNMQKWEKENQEIQLTDSYKISMLTYIGKVSLPHYKAMQETYDKRMDASLDDFKVVIRFNFHDMIEKIAREQTAASLVFSQLEISIRRKVDQELKEVLPGNIRNFNHFMKSKQTLFNQIMKDLLEADKFQEYMKFVMETSKYTDERMKHHINEYLFNENKIFAELATGIAKKIMDSVNQVIEKNSSSKGDLASVIGALIKQICVYLPSMNEYETKQDIVSSFKETTFDAVMFYQYLKSKSKEVLDLLESDYQATNRLDIDTEKHVVSKLLEHLQGCTKKCPFCTVTCSYAIKDHPQACHSLHHNPICLNGFSGQTADGKLSLGTCNKLIASDDKFQISDVKMKFSVGRKIRNFLMYGDVDYGCNVIPFKEYRKVYKDWKIDTNVESCENLFWNRFLNMFKTDLAKYHRCLPPDVPASWGKITKTDVVMSLTPKPM